MSDDSTVYHLEEWLVRLERALNELATLVHVLERQLNDVRSDLEQLERRR